MTTQRDAGVVPHERKLGILVNHQSIITNTRYTLEVWDESKNNDDPRYYLKYPDGTRQFIYWVLPFTSYAKPLCEALARSSAEYSQDWAMRSRQKYIRLSREVNSTLEPQDKLISTFYDAINIRLEKLAPESFTASCLCNYRDAAVEHYCLEEDDFEYAENCRARAKTFLKCYNESVGNLEIETVPNSTIG